MCAPSNTGQGPHLIAVLPLWLLLAATSSALQSDMKLVYKWSAPDWTWESPEQKLKAVSSGVYNPERAIPFSVEVDDNRLFLSYGSFLNGTPATLGTVPRNSQVESPLLTPFPSWSWQYHIALAESRTVDCDRTLVNVLRTKVDTCGRLWVLDSGRRAYLETVRVSQPACPAKLIVFDLKTDKPIITYRLPTDQYTAATIFTSVTVDVSNGCGDAFAYWADCIGQTITTFSWKSTSSWVFRNTRFAPSSTNSSARSIFVQGVPLQLPDGVYQVTLPSPSVTPITGRDSAFWHVLTSYEENTVPLSVLRDRRAADTVNHPAFKEIGSRGAALGQQLVGAVDSRGVMLYTLASQDAVACWNTRRPYLPESQAVLSQAAPGALYPSGLSIVPSQEDPNQEEVWLLSSGVVRVSYASTYKQFQFRTGEDKVFLYRARVRDLVKNSACE